MQAQSIARFWMKAKPSENGCWEWQASLAKGYGQADHRLGHSGLAHRIAYELLVGPIPEGLTLDHLCRNRRCVNPEHLEPVTSAENVLRGESPPAQKARATECPRGHLLSGPNLYTSPKGKRGCRICRKRQQREAARRARIAAAWEQADGPKPIRQVRDRRSA